MRLNVFEFEDFKWFPDFLRKGMMDYLRYFFTVTDYYGPTTDLIEECLHDLSTNTIVDLCSGGGGPVLQLQKDLYAKYGRETDVMLTDLFPNNDSCRYNKKEARGNVYCSEESVDATAVPSSIKGLRTLFSSIHHFGPEEVHKILFDAVKNRQGIAIFDIGDQNLISVLGILIFHPLLLLLMTPFIRPFRPATLLFTYVIPLIPFFTVWDGIMSILRLYNPTDLQKIADSIKADHYRWRSGKVKNKLGLCVTYLIGTPKT